MRWNKYTETYSEATISKESLTKNVDNGDFHEIDGVYYDEIDEDNMTPYNLAHNGITKKII